MIHHNLPIPSSIPEINEPPNNELIREILLRWYRRVEPHDYQRQEPFKLIAIPCPRLQLLLWKKHPSRLAPNIIYFHSCKLSSSGYSIITKENYVYFTYSPNKQYPFRCIKIPSAIGQVRRNIWSRIPPLIEQEIQKEFHFNIEPEDMLFVEVA